MKHPLKGGIVQIVLEGAVLSSRTFVLVATVVVFTQFRLFMIPFKEKEMS